MQDTSYFQFFHKGINVLLPEIFGRLLLQNMQLLNLQKTNGDDDPLPKLYLSYST